MHKKIELILFAVLLIIALSSIFKLYRGVENSGRNTVYRAKKSPKVEYINNIDGKSIPVIPNAVRGRLGKILVSTNDQVRL